MNNVRAETNSVLTIQALWLIISCNLYPFVFYLYFYVVFMSWTTSRNWSFLKPKKQLEVYKFSKNTHNKWYITLKLTWVSGWSKNKPWAGRFTFFITLVLMYQNWHLTVECFHLGLSVFTQWSIQQQRIESSHSQTDTTTLNRQFKFEAWGLQSYCKITWISHLFSPFLKSCT